VEQGEEGGKGKSRRRRSKRQLRLRTTKAQVRREGGMEGWRERGRETGT
jgi:hypothetical protein